MKILILDGETPAATAVAQSLGRSGYDCWVAAATPKALSFRSRYAKARRVYPSSLAGKRRFQDWLVALQQQEKFDLILPCSELTLLPVAEIRCQSDVGRALLLPSDEALAVALHKERSRMLAEAHGFKSPATRMIPADRTSDAPPASFPAVIKPVQSKAWVGDVGTTLHARIVRSEAEYFEEMHCLGAVCDVQVQEWVAGIGIGVELLVDKGRVVSTFAHRRLHEYPLEGGASTYRQAIEVPSVLRDPVLAMMRDLHWHGVAMVEFRYDDQQDAFWFMEINPRFWGSLPLAIAAGVDFPKALLALARDEVQEPRRRRRVKYARSLVADAEWFRVRILNPPRLPIPLPSVVRSVGECLRVLNGRETWDAASWRDPRPIVAEVFGLLVREARIVAARLRNAWLHRARRIHNTHVFARADPPRRVVFVCWGNVCRSPYAANRFAQLVPEAIEVASAGVHADRGQRTPFHVMQVAARRGVDLSGHRATPVQHFGSRDLVVVFDTVSANELFEKHPGIRLQAVWLAALDPVDSRPTIPDPYAVPIQDAGFILARIDRCCEQLARLVTAPDRSLGGSLYAGEAASGLDVGRR